VQTWSPDEQSVVTVLVQGPDAVHAGQTLHVPVGLHTPPVPQAVPPATNVRSVQTGAPDEHSTVALAAQGLDEVQAAPSTQGTHAWVASQTPAAPAAVVQLVPVAA